MALLSPFLLYSGANEVGRASVSVFKPTTDFEQTTRFDQLFAAYLFKLDLCDPRRLCTL